MVLLLLLKPLGVWGIGVLAAIDTAAIAIPMDLIVGGYVWGDRSRFWVYAVLAALGSSIGSLVPYFVGRAGGEWVLLNRVERSKYEQLRTRFERHRWFAVMVPAAMPPPFPFKLFAFGAGIFDLAVFPYMAAVFIGRAVHYLILAILVMRFGPQVIHIAVYAIQKHVWVMVVGTSVLLAAFLVYIFHRRRRRRSRLVVEREMIEGRQQK